MSTDRFLTADGVEVPAVTADQMRQVDRIAIEETGPNLYQMMENAGRSLALEALRRIDPGQPAVVLAGTGGNGGGGICAARHLANRGVEVSLGITDVDAIADVPGQQLKVYRSTPGRIVPPDQVMSRKPELIVDALIGYSLSGAARGQARELIDRANESGAPILSLDVPSGIDATTGATEGAHVEANWTLTLGLPKTGLDTAAAGDLSLADIGIPAEAYRSIALNVSERIFARSFTVGIRPA